MALVDPNEGTVSSAAYGFDTHAALGGDPSLFDSVSNVITKGIPLTGLSIVNSFANTGIEVANLFGANVEKVTADNELSSAGLEDYKNYYDTHQQGIEAAGLLAGSFIPGMAAIKVLKLAQAGKMTSIMARATNIFAGPRQAIIYGALSDIKDAGSLFNVLTSTKVKAIALGAGDQALQALAFETGVAATMKASPLLDQDSFTDTVNNAFYGMLLGGVGGVVEGVVTRALINRAYLNADVATKSAETVSRYGMVPGASYNGSSIAGDRVIGILDSIDKIKNATQDTTLGVKKAQLTIDSATLDAKAALQELVPDGREDLANATFDALVKMHAEGGASKSDAYDYLSRLAAIKQIGDEPSIPTTDSFYVNRFAANNGSKSLDNLITVAPVDSADLSMRYTMKPFSTETKVARFDDTFTATDGTVTPAYATQKDAFAAGNDIWIDKNLKVSVNPDAPNIQGRIPVRGETRVLSLKEEASFQKTGQLPPGSAPVYGAPLVLEVHSGAITSKATPVVGDFGAPKLIPQGLAFGREISAQSMATPLTAGTPTIDANARYVWAAKRGIQRDDTIATTDIPMLEQLYREATTSKNGFSDYMQSAVRTGVTIESEDMPSSANELLQHIRNAKDDLIHDLIVNNNGMSAEEVARRANVPEDYISNNFKAQAPKDYMIDPDTFTTPNHVQLEYNVGNVFQQDGQIVRGLIDSKYRINAIKDAARAAGAKFFGENHEQFNIDGYTSSDATIQGTGPGFFSFSNSDYGTLGQAMERVGRFVTNFVTQKQGAIARELAPVANGIRQDPIAAAELGNFVAVRRRTAETYSFLPPDLAQQYGRTPDTVVVTRSLVRDKNGNIVDWNRDLTPDGFLPTAAKSDRAGEISQPGLHTFYDLSPKVAAFERANQAINDTRLQALNDWYSAQGLNRSAPVGTLYAPPIDTRKYPFLAYVKAREGMALSDDGVAVIVGETQSALNAKISAISSDYSVYTKDMLAKYHQVEGDYLYNRNFAQSAVNSDLQRRGILNDILPDTRAETVLQDYTDFHSRQTVRQIRDYVELSNAQLFAELRSMGERFNTSTAGPPITDLIKQPDNPYNSYIKTALAINEKTSYKLWSDAQEKLEAFASGAYRMARQAFTSAEKGIISFKDASDMSGSMGLGNPYEAFTQPIKAYYNIANQLPSTNILSRFVSTANSVLSATAIRLDAFQSMINIISSPILTSAEFMSASRSPQVQQLLTTPLPDGTNRLVPSVMKSAYTAVGNWFNPAIKAQWLPIYTKMGIVRESSSEYFKMIEALTLPYGKGFSDSVVLQKLSDMVELGSKVTGSQYTENFVRFVAADMARQLYIAAGVDGTQLIDNIGTFVNRVHGNYIASQRPVAFQGPVGQAMSLFQTYQFNLFQQLFRHVENGEGKTLGILAALQTTIFGLQGLPGFQMINNHIIGNAANNPAHKDLYGTIPNLLDRKLGDYLLYGVASNWTQAGLYGRGDINPRQISVLPVNPLEFPAISGAIGFIGNLLNMGDKLVKGGAVSETIMNGLEHNGLSRPLAGLGQMMQGFTTTGDGSLVAVTRPQFSDNNLGWNDIISGANVGRLLGARPLDEAITMDAMYRKAMYDAKDSTRIEALGSATKTYLYGQGQMPENSVQDFATKYAAAGGYIPRFGQEMMKWTQDANVSKANEIFRQLQKPGNQQMMMIMGGQKLPDYTNTGSTATPSSGLAPAVQQ